jgi:hypothetical protein
MPHILAPDRPAEETVRLLGHARHCRTLANAMTEAQLIEQLVALARSYEAKATLLRASCEARP